MSMLTFEVSNVELDQGRVIAKGGETLPPVHADPCGRIIIATAEAIGASVVTSDGLIAQHASAEVVW